MEYVSETLGTLLIYLVVVAMGAWIGGRGTGDGGMKGCLSSLQQGVLLLLLGALGVELGSKEEIQSSLAAIGLQALILTLCAMVGSGVAVFLLRRFVLKLDRRGYTTGQSRGEESENSETSKGTDHRLTWNIFIAVGLGMAVGSWIATPELVQLSGQVVQWGLYLLLFFVGADLGGQRDGWKKMGREGMTALVVPVGVAVGTLSMASLASLVLPLSPKDCMAASAGFGWYSLAPTLLAPHSPTLSATAFLSNLLHELLAIVTVPWVARQVGYLEAVALPGATAMDTVLPVVVRATSERMALYAFVSGAVLSLCVPILVPALVSLPGG